MELSQRERVEKFLAENYEGKFFISDAPNANGKLEVDSKGFVELIRNIEHLTTDDFIFTKVMVFNCGNKNALQSLKGAPQEVNEFICYKCSSLLSLEGAPQKVNKFSCVGCSSLLSLEGAPQKVNIFYCNDCESLQSLNGAPKEVKKFYCAGCTSLQSLDKMPICDTLNCDKRFKNSIPTKKIKKEVIFRKFLL